MSAEASASQLRYGFHGVTITVSSREPAVLEAMDLRLRDFAGESACDSALLRLAFASDDLASGTPVGNRRPVYETPHGSLSYFPASDLVAGEFGGVRLTCDPARGSAVLHSERFSGRSLYLATHPLTTVSLMLLLERRGLFSLHAGCLATADGHGVLVAGPSGAGKSTLTLALTRTGMSFVSDDVVFLDPGAGPAEGVRVLGFADTVGLTEHAAACFGELRLLLEVPPADGFPKRLHRIEDLFGATPLQACVPRALVFPEVTLERASTIVPLHSGEALLRLVPDVLLTQPTATQAHLAAIGALLGQVRCYTLRSGKDLERAAELVRSVA